jgi:8-oxo-dGTP pyrophosphatase MutT (NUDIX family)
MTPEPPAPRDAATVIVCRDGHDGPEILLLRRHTRSGFVGGAWVFPGGTVDDGDRVLPRTRWDGIDPGDLVDRFAEPEEVVLGLHVAAVRETFEEAGLLLARHADGRVPDTTAPGYAEARRDLGDRAVVTDWDAWLADEDLVLDLGCLTYHSRWVTPVQEPRRYDTAFFLARAPEGQVAAFDRVETTEQRWTTPEAALEVHAEGDLFMIFPTIKTLESLTGAASADELVARAAEQERVRSIQPHIEVEDGRLRILHPDDPDFPRDAAGGA